MHASAAALFLYHCVRPYICLYPPLGATHLAVGALKSSASSLLDLRVSSLQPSIAGDPNMVAVRAALRMFRW